MIFKDEKERLDVVFLLDMSGSMQGMEEDTIGGYNGYLDNMKDSDAKVTTILFNGSHEMITNGKYIKNVKKLSRKQYIPGGSTALLDAIGDTIKYMDEKCSNKVLFIITTDGEENSSRRYTKEDIKRLINIHNNWEFIYLGADIDSYSEASSIGIKSNRTSNYKKTSKGVSKLFDKLKNMSWLYMEENSISDNWKDGLDD